MKARRPGSGQTAARAPQASSGRAPGWGVLALGVAGFCLFALGVDPSLQTTFAWNSGATQHALSVPDLVVPSFATVLALTCACSLLGGYQLVVGSGRSTNRMIGLAILLFTAAALVWAARNGCMNMTGMLRLSVVQAVPLLLGALSGILCERSGVINIAIEGLMLTGSLVSVVAASLFGNPVAGVLAAMVSGGMLAYIHALLCLRYRMDQIISGMMINILAAGMTGYISVKLLVQHPAINQSGILPTLPVPGLSSLPVLGPILFDQNVFYYAAVVLLLLVHLGLHHTRWGLRTRMVGEHPLAAATLGIRVLKVRYLAVILGGCIAGLAGASLTLGAVGRFDRLMTAGRGYIGLAAMILGNWNPTGAMGASLVFGFASSLQSKLSILDFPIPSQFLLMIPYIVTMLFLVGVVGRVTPPAADGQPYEEGD